MKKISAFAISRYVAAKNFVKNYMKEQRGEINVIAIVLLLVVVIALVIIFRDQITGLVRNIFGRVEAGAGEFMDDTLG